MTQRHQHQEIMKVEIFEYDRKWPEKYESEKSLLLDILSGVIDDIHHIGSTSVEDCAAKPIIDILLEVTSLNDLDDASSKIISMEYEALGEYGIPGRRYFRKSHCCRKYQIHAFVSGDNNIIRHIAFRDYLKEHPDIKKKYVELKVKLAVTFSDDIAAYCDGKDHFIKCHEAKALEWINLS